MADRNCGNCDYQGNITQTTEECLIDGKVYEKPHTCDRFKQYVHGRNKEERLALALKKSKEEEDARKTKEDRDFSEKLAQKDREHTEELAQKDRDHAAELARLQREQNKKLWRASWWWQLILVIFGGVIGFVLKLISN